MGIASARAKVIMSQPKPNSKTQIEKRKKLMDNPIKVIACKNCHSQNVTLRRGPDSYYCRFCYDKLFNKKNKKKKEK